MVDGKSFAERIDYSLKQRKQSRKVLTSDLGISSSTISSWSASRGSIPRIDVAAKIARYLGVSLDWLITGDEDSGYSHSIITILQQLSRLSEKDINEVAALVRGKYEYAMRYGRGN